MRLRSHLLVLALGTLLPMVVFAAVAAWLFVQNERETFERGARDRMLAILTAVDTELQSSINTLDALATSRHLDTDDLRAFHVDARRVLESHPDWITINLALPTGEQVLNVLRPLGALLPMIAEPSLVAQVARTGNAAVGNILLGPVTGQYDFAVRTPVRRLGVTRYVLSAVIKPEVIGRLLAAQRLPRDWVGVVVDRNHRIVARTVAPERTVGQLASESVRAALARSPEGWFRGTTLENFAVYTPYARSSFSGWTVAMGVPAAYVDAAERKTVWTMTLGLVFAVGVAAVLALGLGRRIAGPITALASAATAVGRGTQPEIPRGVRVQEVDELARALERAAAAVHAREATQARLAAIVESSSEAIVSCAVDGTILTWNPAAERLFGYAPGAIVGRPLSLLLPPDARPDVETILAAGARGEPLAFETVGVKHDGTTVPVAWSVAPIRNAAGPVTGLSAAIRDITEPKRAEEERTRLLENERRAREEAQTANRAKDEFLAMLGHELRNPLGAIFTAARLLERVGKPDEHTSRALGVIVRQADHLARLVDDLLDVGRVMAGKIVLDRRALDLAECVHRSVATFRAAGRLEAHQVRIDARPAWIHADAVRVEQIVTNLVANALKFTPAGGTIRVVVEPVAAEAVLRVEDSGVGIAEDLLPRVFDLFVQGDQALDRAQGGLGIGLTLVRQLAELHGGAVTAASAGRGRGSVFTVRFPRIEAQPLHVGRRRPASPAATPLRVLVVEDNRDAREMMRHLLVQRGHAVLDVSDGASALETARQTPLDVGVIDIGLPEVDGYAVARELRAMPAGKRMLLVALTGYGMPEDRHRSREAGFDAHLVKPVDPDTLLAMLERPEQAGDEA
ncbi:MAG TPA: ATP-binding protein [Candidatus Tectomicrobia bacterium]|nr:ATP-binding protein [Candidatus Tectomicrobia bacterium]